MSDLDKAREWAESLAAWPTTDRAQAAAKVIQSLPDVWVDAEKMQKWYGQVEGLLPYWAREEFTSPLPPKLRTLADMTAEERAACKWMQARLEGSELDFVISDPMVVGSRLWAKGGTTHIADNSLITPLPDLPKLEWPGSEPAEPPALTEDERIGAWDEIASHKFFDDCYRDGVLLDHMMKKLDEVVDAEIVEEPENVDTPPAEKVTLSGMWVDDGSSPVDAIKFLIDKYEELDRLNPEDVPPNEPWLIEVDGQKAIGTRHKGNTIVPWSVAALDGSFAGDFHDSEVTLIHKLVAEPPALPEGMRLADHEQYGRVITSPKPNRDGVYDLLVPRPNVETGADWDYAHECELTFLGGAENG